MKLLNTPLDYREEYELKNMLEGNIARICISENTTEILTSLGFAINRLALLAYSNTLKLKQSDSEKIPIEQARKALNTIKDFEGVDPAYISEDLAAAYEILEIFIKQQETQ